MRQNTNEKKLEPKMPRNYYKNDGWIGIRDWLGIE